jgi:hypothetical protein
MLLPLAALSFILGAALLKLSFYIADGTHSWRSRLLYLGTGLCAAACIWTGVFLTLKSIVIRGHLYAPLFS